MILNYCMLKISTTILLFSFCIELSHAQNNKIDSIDRLISKATTDTQKINLINKKIGILSTINIDTSISLGKKNIEEAKKIKYRKGEAEARIKLASNYCIKGEFEAAEENLKIS